MKYFRIICCRFCWLAAIFFPCIFAIIIFSLFVPHTPIVKQIKKKYAFKNWDNLFSVYTQLSIDVCCWFLLLLLFLSVFFCSYNICLHHILKAHGVLINKLYCSCLKAINLNRILSHLMSVSHTHTNILDTMTPPRTPPKQGPIIILIVLLETLDNACLCPSYTINTIDH